MEKNVIRLGTLISGLLLVSCVLVSECVLADNGINQYGLGVEGLSRLPADTNTLDFTKELKTELSKTSDTQIETPALQFEIDYQDKTDDLFFPHSNFNIDSNHRLKNNSGEYKTRMGYRFDYLTPEAAVKYSPDFYGLGKYYNYELGVAVPVKDMFSLETHYGWNRFDKKPENRAIKDFQDWSIGVSTTYKGMKLKVDYIDINASENSEECGQSLSCEGKTVFSIIKNF